MSNRIHALAQQLIGKATLEECSLDELRHIVKRHPYFAPAQFLLLQKFNQLNSEETGSQQKKAVLFYHDPLLFDYFISSDKFYVDEASLLDEKKVSSLNEFNDTTSEESLTQGEFNDKAENEVAEVEEEPTGVNESIETNGFATDVVELSPVEVKEVNNSVESFEETNPDNRIEKTENKVVEVDEEPASVDIPVWDNELAMDVVESIEDVNTTASVEIPEANNNQESVEEGASAEKQIEHVEDKLESKPEEISSGQNLVSNSVQQIPPEKNLITGNTEPLATPTTNQELIFEPYHTVDYFASQGIRISQEELPKDKLSKQLKSFTEWLKTMKRLPATPMTASVEASAEKTVEAMAGISISESNVVTEAMAEVWAKQGNREKAIEIYNKLSLLDPSKTAYFAAKIENLKHF